MVRWTAILLLLWSFQSFASDAVEEALEGMRPDWSRLDALQGTVSRERFLEELETVYAPYVDWSPWITVEAEGAWIATTDDDPKSGYYLRFGDNGEETGLMDRGGLRGLRIAIDPGHLGGEWAEMERRQFAVGDGPIVKEGDLVLATALRLQAMLEAEGAEVFLTRMTDAPATELRPSDLKGAAAERLKETQADEAAVTVLAERLFYRTAEIRARASVLNDRIRPDLVVALHINAGGWEDPENPQLLKTNDAHVLVNGCYLEGEVGDESERLEMVWRIAKGYHKPELTMANAVARSMVETTRLAPYEYKKQNATRMGNTGYVWARNLLANRIFDCPVVYLEPWIANSEAVYEWAGAGDYVGERDFGGKRRESLPAVYAWFVYEGIRQAFEAKR